MSADTSFKPGRRFSTADVQSSQEYLDAAIGAAQYIARYKKNDADGVYWESPTPIPLPFHAQGIPNINLYDGAAGIAYFYLKLWQVTGDETYLNDVRGFADYASRHWRALVNLPEQSDATLPPSAGLYPGVGGLIFVLEAVYDAAQYEPAREAVRDMASFYADQARHDAQGAYWTGNTSILFDGGVILALIAALRVQEDSNVRSVLESAARRYLHIGEYPNNYFGVQGFKGADIHTSPNLEFGAGAVVILSQLHRFLGDRSYLDRAVEIAREIETSRIEQRNGYLFPFHINEDGPVLNDGGKPLFYISTCNGPAGTIRAFYALHALTGDRHYKDVIDSLADGLESLGAPEAESYGFWYNLTYCCGHAGLLQTFVGLYEAYREPRWLDLAQRTASVILGERQTDGEADWWLNAFQRVKPDDINQDLGYFDGAAGIASTLLQLYLAQTNAFEWHRFLDDPLPERAVQQ